MVVFLLLSSAQSTISKISASQASTCVSFLSVGIRQCDTIKESWLDGAWLDGAWLDGAWLHSLKSYFRPYHETTIKHSGQINC